MLPPGAKPITVLHLSDLHMAPWQRDKQDWVRGLADLKPDLIVDTGDNLGHQRGIEGIRRAFEPFRGVPGVFVNGSNDYFGPVLKNPFAYFAGPSKHIAQGQAPRHRRAALGSSPISAGRTSTTRPRASTSAARTSSSSASTTRTRATTASTSSPRPSTSCAPKTRSATRPGPTRHPPPASPDRHGRRHARAVPARAQLVREPRRAAHLRRATRTAVRCACRASARSSPTATSRASQVKGLSVWRHGLRAAFLNVSAGLGTSIFAPVRFACPPEATLLTLVPTE